MLSLHPAVIRTGNNYPWIGLLRLLEKLKRFTANVWCQGCDLHREMYCMKSPLTERQPMALTTQGTTTNAIFCINVCIICYFCIYVFVA